MTIQLDWTTFIGSKYPVLPVKRLFRVLNGATPSSGEESYWDGDIQWVTPEDLGKQHGRILNTTRRSITQAGYLSCGTSLMPAGSVVLSTRAPIGHAATAGTSLCTNQGCKGLVPQDGVSGPFFYYVLLAAKAELQSRGNGATFAELSYHNLSSFPVPVPTSDEQRAIADFLDREVQKIDTLVGSQRHLIRLIEEQRLAQICHAVTQGLNPSVRRKPSGIPWLDAVPDHWTVLAAKRVSKVFVPQRNKPDLNSTGVGIPWITMEQIGGEQTRQPHQWVSDEAASNAGSRVLGPGAVIASCVGIFGVASINTESVIINQQLQAYIPSHRVSATFLRLSVIGARNYFEQVATEATLTYVNQERFGNMPLPLPPLHEQEQITGYLTRSSTLFNTAINGALKTIGLLNEYRISLISAAVTGQIDVRNYRPQEAAALCQ